MRVRAAGFFSSAARHFSSGRHVVVDESWRRVVEAEVAKPYFCKIKNLLMDEEANGFEIFPPRDRVFEALNRCPLDKTRVVIVGQDPYHQPGQADGLAFSISSGQRAPPSLLNIVKELSRDLQIAPPPSKQCSLEKWADQGVLLLNTTLTVRKGQAGSHAGKGWETFTEALLKAVCFREANGAEGEADGADAVIGNSDLISSAGWDGEELDAHSQRLASRASERLEGEREQRAQAGLAAGDISDSSSRNDCAGVVFLLWGRHAQQYKPTIEACTRQGAPPHYVLTSSHPSPLGATKTNEPFMGCGHFSKTNSFLKKQNMKEIDWTLP